MARIAIVHLPDHTPGDVDSLFITCMPVEARIVGVYEFPARREVTCTGNCVKGKTGAWRRDPHGFMKCGICGSRNTKVRRWFTDALFDWFGANLLGHDAPALFRTPEGYGVHTTD